jgi:carbonic anhydrase/acetyltransferase-like protein (isoleucine patch superfamily)
VKDGIDDFLADPHNISIGRRTTFHSFELFNMHSVSDIRQIEIHTAELLGHSSGVWTCYCRVEKV